MSHDDEQAVAEALEQVAGLSNREAARRVGVSEATMRRWREGRVATPLRDPVKGAVYRFTGRATEGRAETHRGGNGSAPADYPDGGIATADQIIDTFGRPEALRRQAGHIPAKDAARAGYALAQRLQLPPAGMKRILEWHDEIMGAAGEGG